MIVNLLTIIKSQVCTSSAVKHVMVILGYLIIIIKVLIPVILIIMGVRSFLKIVLDDDSDISKGAFDLIKRFIVAATIFFIPTIFSVVFDKMLDTNVDQEFVACTNCMLKPSSCLKELLVQKEEERKELEEKLENEKHNNKETDANDHSSVNNGSGNSNSEQPTTEEYHVNSINGIKYNLYNQVDPRWKNVGTIGENGCHIVSAAVVASAYDKSITPKTVHSKHTNSFPYTVVNDMAGEGFNCKHIYDYSKDVVITELKKGNPIVIMVYGKKKGGASPFTSSQHYMALIDYKDGMIFVGNSYSSGGHGRSGWYDEDEVLKSIKEINLCEPTEKMLKNNTSDDTTSDANIVLKSSYHTDQSLRYVLYTPFGATNNKKKPLIVWLHGSVEKNALENTFKNSGLLAALNNWTLDGINAYILCPISTGDWSSVRDKLYNLIEYVSNEKNIDKNQIVLVGHSMGGIGVQTIANNNIDYFSAFVILSGYNAGVNLDQFKNTKIRAYAGSTAYGEDTASYNYTTSTLANAIGVNNTFILNTYHGGVPKMAFNLDENKNNKSDLIEWMFN